jgi:hypothetical protein
MSARSALEEDTTELQLRDSRDCSKNSLEVGTIRDCYVAWISRTGSVHQI